MPKPARKHGLEGPHLLRREVGTFGAVMIGMGSIVGTGVFVSIGLAVGVAGPAVLIALLIGAGLAACNGLSSAQLAASHAVAGGTYEYGYRYSTPVLGFTAGWTFLAAKSASAATAALGFAGYVLNAAGVGLNWLVPLAIGVVALLTVLVLAGIRRTSAVNIAIVSITLAALAFFVLTGLPAALPGAKDHFSPFFAPGDDGVRNPFIGVLYASALMFVAYTGYGRIATLGEEVREPQRTIPRAVIITLAASMMIYMAVAAVAIAAVGAPMFFAATQERAAPLEIISRMVNVPGAPLVLALGAVTAMAGVLLNLLLGLSRVMLAMGRRGDMPAGVARIDAHGTPAIAVIVVAIMIAVIALVGDVKIAWSFSALTVLVYYAITNWCALRLPVESRLYPRWIAWAGLFGCLALAAFIEWRIMLAGLSVIALGLMWHAIAQRVSRPGRRT